MNTRAIVVVLDGLRRDHLSPALTPNLAGFAAGATRFAAHRSMFPSATRVVSASFATGCRPARHGLAGNGVALMEDGRLVACDVGRPDFMDRLRRVRGRTLLVPTLAERLAAEGREAMIFSNVSPGAARAHDPDGHGWVFHRAWSHAPSLQPLTGAEGAAGVTLDAQGDARMTDLFLTRALSGREAALGVLWLGEPDASQHAHPLGSPAVLDAIAAADRCFGRVQEAVTARRAAGEDILLVACSDHGHETVQEVIDIEAEFVAAGLKHDADDCSLLSVANGTAALVYLHPVRAADGDRILNFLLQRPWAGRVLTGAALEEVGQAPADHLFCAVAMAHDGAANAFGISGRAFAAKPGSGKPDRLGCGQHGGLGTAEQSPFLLVQGTGFAPGRDISAPTSPIDIAPTVLRHLAMGFAGCEGRSLQDA